MLVFKIGALAVVITIIALLLKQSRPDIAMLLTIAGGIVIILMVLKEIAAIFGWFNTLAAKTNIDSNIIKILIKILGIGYIAEFAASACEDAGNKSMAEKVVLAAKIVILVLSLPILNSVVETIVGVL